MRLSLVAGLLAAVALLPVSALAADLSTPLPSPPAAPLPVPSNWYVEIFGGAALPGTVVAPPNEVVLVEQSDNQIVDDADPTVTGWAGGGAVGVNFGPEGLSAEVDALAANSPYSDADGSFDTFSLMANLKYTAHLTDSFDVYGAVGAGGIHARDMYDGELYANDTEAGYQLIAGAGFSLNPNWGIIAEYRYQNTFSPFAEENGVFTETHANNVVLVGIKYSP